MDVSRASRHQTRFANPGACLCRQGAASGLLLYGVFGHDQRLEDLEPAVARAEAELAVELPFDVAAVRFDPALALVTGDAACCEVVKVNAQMASWRRE